MHTETLHLHRYDQIQKLIIGDFHLDQLVAMSRSTDN